MKNVFGEVNANDFDRIHDRFSPEKFSASERKKALFAAEKGAVHHITTANKAEKQI
ncbi:hypothetical protein [Xenorhabdus sp. NBAII XenSa04]|uniref:hypothetical protein n=1 Tax=Xenorhabdus sp. NBAII XenSa04 TaxID=1429873 RepID=UPI000AF5D27B